MERIGIKIKVRTVLELFAFKYYKFKYYYYDEEILYLFQEYFSGSNAEKCFFILKHDLIVGTTRRVYLLSKICYDDYSNRKFVAIKNVTMTILTGSSNIEPEPSEPGLILVLQSVHSSTTTDECTGTSDLKQTPCTGSD